MIPQSESKIFLSAERGHTETDWFRSYATFNFGAYYSEHKKPFGILCLLNDETLGGGRSLSYQPDEDVRLVLLPVVGAIQFTASEGFSVLIEAGQCWSIVIEKGVSYNVFNPYENELVNYLQLWIRTDEVKSKATTVPFSFQLDENKNTLLPITSFFTDKATNLTTLYIGKFDGRSETSLPLTAGNAAFFFVIEGAFEVANRLLEARDGLGLRGMNEVELEALSNEAIIIALQFNYQ